MNTSTVSSTLLGCIVCIALLVSSSSARAAYDAARADEKDRLRTQWLAAGAGHVSFDDVIERLIEFRKTPGGRDLEIDYMIGTGLCRSALRHRRESGLTLLRVLEQGRDYHLTFDELKAIQNEIEICGSNEIPVAPRFIARVSGRFQMTPELIGFPVAEGIVDYRYPIQLSEILGRLEPYGRFDWSKFYMNMLMQYSKSVGVVHSDGMLVVTSSDLDSATKLVKRMDRFRLFFSRAFGAEFSRFRATTIVAPNKSVVDALAHEIHGVSLSPNVFAYSVSMDQTIIFASDRYREARSLHEYVHLLVQADFGNAPPWINEGLACLFEESSESDNDFVGVGNYRIDEAVKNRLSLRKLLELSWNEFYESPGGSYANSRAFMLFIQEQGHLSTVYRAFRDIPLGQQVDPLKSLGEALKQEPSVIEQSFSSWLDAHAPHAAQQAFKVPLARGTRGCGCIVGVGVGGGHGRIVAAVGALALVYRRVRRACKTAHSARTVRGSRARYGFPATSHTPTEPEPSMEAPGGAHSRTRRPRGTVG